MSYSTIVRSIVLTTIVLGFICSLLLSSCSKPTRTNRGSAPVPVLLISIDGYRYDYIGRTEAPYLDALIAGGTRAEWMTPAFPTLTFPNHYTLVTGLYPENHGIVANNMYDPEFKANFGMSIKEAVTDGRWWEGEPIWVTAEKQGMKSATYFWPGSEAAIGGVRPSYWKPYEGSVPYSERVDTVLAWLDLPQQLRPSILTLYFSRVDEAGHSHGPDSEEVDAAIREVDAALGRLVEGLKRRNMLHKINIIIVSDHGMSEVAPERTIFLDEVFNTDSLTERIIWGEVTAITPKPGMEEAVYQALKAHPELPMKVYKKNEMPERYHFSKHRRIAPVLCIADDGWGISNRSYFGRRRNFLKGAHGFDNSYSSMRALFVAHGPAFRAGKTVAPFDNIHLYSLITHLLGLQPAPNDGSLDSVRYLIK